MAADQQWALPYLRPLLPLDTPELLEIVSYASSLPDSQAAKHLESILGDSPEAVEFVSVFMNHRKGHGDAPAPVTTHNDSEKAAMAARDGFAASHDSKDVGAPPAYAPPPGPPPQDKWPGAASGAIVPEHTNAFMEACKVRARDEQIMQQMLQDVQYKYRIYNSEIEPEHETDFYCGCPIHQYQQAKWRRLGMQQMWSKAVMYPGEKHYDDYPNNPVLFSGNPYRNFSIGSPYGYRQQAWNPNGVQRPVPSSHASWMRSTIALNNQLNHEAQAKVDGLEPKYNIWEVGSLSTSFDNMTLDYKGHGGGNEKGLPEKPWGSRPGEQPNVVGGSQNKRASKLSGFRKAFGVRSSEEKATERADQIREAILAEERSRWPGEYWRHIVFSYQEKVGMAKKIADLRARYPLQYLHLLRAGYFEPIPVAWADQASNPMKFSIEAASGWRGITPSWRGYEDLAEERLYWVLNHREGSVGMRMKPDFISEINMAQARMARAVEPPPLYYSADDTCRVQHTSGGYSKQVMSAPYVPFDRPENPADDTMILLDVSGSMDFDPVRPMYNQYLITGYARSSQPKNKDVARAIVRRFTDAMANHDHQQSGYDLITFSNHSRHVGQVNHRNLDLMWRTIRFGGGTRVMTGWQQVKNLHFQKHAESATHHPVYGWQAGPKTPMLRLLLLLDGEATDMDEFELDLLSLNWAHVTIFLIGVDGCPHHHRHANELQRISDVNHHVSFVDAQGNFPERYVTHELLKRHLGYDVSMQEFERMEQLPAYSVEA